MTTDPQGWLAAWTSSNETHDGATECPSPEQLWAAARGEAAAEVVRGLVLHTAACAACAEDWRLARGLSAEIGGEPVSVGPAVRFSARPRFRWALAATLASLAVGLGWFVRPELPRPGDGSGVYRAADAGVISSRVPEDEPLPRAACVLRWSAGPPGSRYSVRVATEDLRVVARAADLENPEWSVPESTLVALPSGSRLLWQVEVRTPDGATLSSLTFAARLE